MTAEENAREMTALWRSLEEVFQARLTLHDHIKVFIMPDGVKLLPKVNVHLSPCCAFWYSSRERCNNHCSFAAARKAAEEKKPFEHTCFCGVTELVMPLYTGKIHAATLFAGMFRKKDFDVSAFPRRYRQLYAALPEWDDPVRKRLETLLYAAGYALLKLAENVRSSYADEQGRTGRIRQFFRTRFNEPVGVSDLAAELGLSESRTIHILLEEFGKGFSRLLAEERLRHVERLLTESELPLKKIAEMTGFSNEYYLNSVFKKYYGRPPGKTRTSHGRPPASE